MDGNPFGRHHRHTQRGAFPFDPQPLEANDDFSAPWPAPASGIAGVSPASASAAVSISHFLPTHFNPPNASAFGAAAGSPADRSAAAAQPFLRNEVQFSAPSAPFAPSPAAALEFALLESQLLSAVAQQSSHQASHQASQQLLTCIKTSTNEDAIAMVLLLLLEEQRAAKETSFFLKRLRVIRSEYLLRHHSLVRSIELNLHRDVADNNAIRQQEIQRLRRVCVAGMTAGASLSQHQMVYRRLWTRPRSRAWWEECIDPNYPTETFRKTFRMSRETFMELCEILGPLIVKRSTRIREAIPVDIRIGASIWRLATAEPLHLISRRFGLGQTTVHFVSNDVLRALNEVVLPKVVVWPEPGSTRAAEISSQFLDLFGLDHASSVAQQLGNGKLIATLYTTHLPINTPRSNLAKYHNKQHTERFARPSYSIAMQTAIDANGQFLDLCIGLPGALSDEEVLQQSTLHQKGQAGELEGAKVIGLRSYPLLDWLLVPYAQSESSTWYQATFNEYIEKGTAVGKDAIGRLKGRWRILLRRAEGKLHELPRLVGACCALHNFLEQKGEAFDSEWAYEAFDDFVPAKRADEESPAAVAERDALAHGMFQAVHGWEGDAANTL
ncbi:unnamed protein product [Closterium sp. Yama58-4]|nr:unnamed protein product [Closterium sp. Yama58-4]